MKSADESYFLISQEDVYKIDNLIGALNLAITEILESRPIHDHRTDRTVLQQQYDELVTPYLYPEPDPPIDPRQSQFEF